MGQNKQKKLEPVIHRVRNRLRSVWASLTRPSHEDSTNATQFLNGRPTSITSRTIAGEFDSPSRLSGVSTARCTDAGDELRHELKGDAVTDKEFNNGLIPLYKILPPRWNDGSADSTTNKPEAPEHDRIVMARDQLQKLEESLSSQSLQAFESTRRYIPLDALQKTLTINAICDVLPACIPALQGKDSEIKEIAYQIYGICGGDDVEPTRSSISYIKTLAILVLIHKTDQLQKFLDHGVDNTKLPVRNLHETAEGERFEFRLHDSVKPTPCFDGWKLHELRQFWDIQWRVLAPVFNQKPKVNSQGITVDTVVDYEFEIHRPLPFQEVTDQNPSTMTGNYSKVKPVEINKFHHNLPSYSVRLVSELKIFFLSYEQANERYSPRRLPDLLSSSFTPKAPKSSSMKATF